MDDRYAQLLGWLEGKLEQGFTIQTLGGDASFRRYYRILTDERSFIASDMPPTQENPVAFKDITVLLLDNGVRAPAIHAADVSAGLFLLDDFGDTTYLNALSNNTADLLYKLAIDELLKIQAIEDSVLPAYDRTLLLEEMQLFTDWYYKIHLGKSLNARDKKIITQSYDYLADNALAQPQVFVHRDYHSRNLMLCADRTIGVLDYQDAVSGAITYDLVSLLKDCYIEWQPSQRLKWLRYYLANTPHQLDEEQFILWFDLMGIQRHLKATGIFARLYHRDHKPGYLTFIPRNLRYIGQVSAHYPKLADMHTFIEDLAR
ncbi:MAG: phosphotransferase [Chromatiales bacterium]|nr:phosphotransferase [Chromatiales bacterium]